MCKDRRGVLHHEHDMNVSPHVSFNDDRMKMFCSRCGLTYISPDGLRWRPLRKGEDPATADLSDASF